MTERDVQLARVVELFTKHGASNGLVPAAMLKKVMGACCPTLSQREVERLVEAMDTEKNGKVPLTQFIAWMFRTFEDVIEEWRTDKELEKISETLPSGLQKLGLSFVCPDQFTDVGLAHIGNSLPATLQTLALAFEFSWTECKISNEGFGKLVAKLPQGLLSLDLILRNDELTDEALEALGRAMPGNLTRAAISFKDNDSFTDKGMSALIASLPSSLTELVLNFEANSHLSDLSLQAFAAWMRKGTSLQKLHFIDNASTKITQAGLQELYAAMPSTGWSFNPATSS
ncbi:unnamed protein product [Effrenium voratum]|uniref:EF-hand domain-containing protein n=1 Tax=Effrenium voratum TaxID=2562239 RepID=A0AA36MX74_9DINO|nr:unnamed protein product [Effrenium voratum]CAJ1425691.1 unnamed protein product [Effrenium voratum]CAJ1436936.1 unnamed protein product [Effrenium voratum]